MIMSSRQFCGDLHRIFSLYKIILHWISLPGYIVDSDSVNQLLTWLDWVILRLQESYFFNRVIKLRLFNSTVIFQSYGFLCCNFIHSLIQLFQNHKHPVNIYTLRHEFLTHFSSNENLHILLLLANPVFHQGCGGATHQNIVLIYSTSPGHRPQPEYWKNFDFYSMMFSAHPFL